jgi:hypothetical protein
MARSRNQAKKSAASPGFSRTKASKKSQLTPSPKTKATARAAAPVPSASTLLNHSQDTTDEWFRSPCTKKGYANYVKSGKSWLTNWVANNRLDDHAEGHNEVPTDERSRFAEAFDTLTEQTPIALRLLTAYKCDHGGKGFSTAEGLRSAFKQYFERYRL